MNPKTKTRMSSLEKGLYLLAIFARVPLNIPSLNWNKSPSSIAQPFIELYPPWKRQVC